MAQMWWCSGNPASQSSLKIIRSTTENKMLHTVFLWFEAIVLLVNHLHILASWIENLWRILAKYEGDSPTTTASNHEKTVCNILFSVVDLIISSELLCIHTATARRLLGVLLLSARRIHGYPPQPLSNLSCDQCLDTPGLWIVAPKAHLNETVLK